MKKKRRYYITPKALERRQISTKLINHIKKIQNKLQMKENLKYGSKAQNVTFIYASKEVIKSLK